MCMRLMQWNNYWHVVVAKMWWQSLLPVYAVSFRMRWRESSNPGFFHHAALSSWLRTVLDSPDDFDLSLTLDALEQGRRRFTVASEYRFTLFGMGDRGRELISDLPDAISRPRRWDKPMPFRDNWELVGMEDWQTQEPILNHVSPLVLDAGLLADEARFWRTQQRVFIELTSPWRVLKSAANRKHAKGEMRYCRDSADLSCDGLWLLRIDDALRSLTERYTSASIPREMMPHIPIAEVDLFWANDVYRNERGKVQPVGGLLGEIAIHDISKLDDASLQILILGQYLGVGQRRAFGNGRYRLRSKDKSAGIQRTPSVGWLEMAMQEDNLHQAWKKISDHQDDRETDELDTEERTEAWDSEGMLKRASSLLHGDYRPPAMRGFVHEDADGGIRPLAAAPFYDRVMQRAVQQILAPALDLLMNTSSCGYRSGRSRYQVRDLIQRLHREGYRWVFESDIRSFFDTVSWQRLRVRLQALLADESMVDALMAWMQATVIYQSEHIERHSGLPQGSPLSPLLANVMLDDFDHDLTDAGCRLIRFADDFVIVSKTEQAARQGGRLAEKALKDVGLSLNKEKTRLVPFSDGFRFLGFMFVDGIAVECSPERSESAGKPPPLSWLAKAMSKDAEQDETRFRGDMPAPIGLFEGRGQMLIFCGESSVVFTRAGRVRIERDDTCLMESPWGHLDGIILFGRHHISTPAMLEALAHHVPIHLASRSGRYRGMLYNPESGSNMNVWRHQDDLFSNDVAAMQAAKSVVDARIRHMCETLRRRDIEGVSEVNTLFKSALREVGQVHSREQLNGVEGHASKVYFGALRQIIPEKYGFEGRKRRPPPDPFNALLSLGYTQLYAYVDTLLRADGLLPERGFYHQTRSCHAALASDLMEPFRHVVERCALSMIQRDRLTPDDFTMVDGRGCRLSAQARRVYLGALCQALGTEVTSTGGVAQSVLEHVRSQNMALKMWIAGKSHDFSAWRMR